MVPARNAITLLLLITPSLALAQSTGSREGLQHVIFNLRSCVRAHAPTAQAAGVRTKNEAVEFLLQKCDAALESDFAKLGAGALTPVPPGIFRRAVQDEWAAFEGGLSNR